MTDADTAAIARTGPLGAAQEFEWWKLFNGIGTNVIHRIPTPPTCRNKVLDRVRRVFERHEALRTSFALDHDQGVPIQIVHRCVDFDVSECDADSPEVPEFLRRVQERGFSVTDTRLIRIGLLTRKEEVAEVVAVISHAIYDGRSKQIVQKELVQALCGQEFETPGLPDRPQPVDSAVSERSGDLARAVRAAERFWGREIKNIPNRLLVPSRGRVLSHCRADYESRDAIPLLSGVARRFQATPSVVYTAAVLAILAVISGRDTPVVRSHFAGRSPVEFDSVGCYHQILPLAISVADRPAFSTIIDRVKAKTFLTQSRYRIGYLRLRELMTREEALRGVSLADGVTINFDYWGPVERILEKGGDSLGPAVPEVDEGVRLESLGDEPDNAGMDAYLMVRLTEASMRIVGNFNSASLRRGDTLALLTGVERILRRIIAAGDATWNEMVGIIGRDASSRANSDSIARGADVGSASALARLLESHPKVSSASVDVVPEDGESKVVARVLSRSSDVSPENLREHVLVQLHPAVPVLLPDRFIIDYPDVPSTDQSNAENKSEDLSQTLRDVIVKYHPGWPGDMSESYTEGGCGLAFVPAMIRDLKALGLAPPPAQEFARPVPLASIARRIKRVCDTSEPVDA